jgi:CheY-like chemotaxis protein
MPVLVSVSALLEDPETPASVRPTLELARRNVELEARLIDDLLDVTRITQGKLRLDREPVDAHDLVLRALEICRDEIAAKDLRLEVELSAGARHVQGDPARLQQILWNLIKNAAKFTPPGGSVAVRSLDGDGDGRLAIVVSDTGIGIDPEVIPRVFDAFEQGDPTVTRRFGGLGLGLAISRSLAEGHGGSIVVESAGRGRGSTFRLTLPTTEAPVSPAAVPRPEVPAAFSSPPLRILLVEDNLDGLRVMARLLGRRGHLVRTSASFEEALREGQSDLFDLVISDIGLPDGSGLDLMRRLGSRIALGGIALSGYGMEEDIRRSGQAGFVAHLTKPVDFARLEAAIRRVALEGGIGAATE